MADDRWMKVASEGFQPNTFKSVTLQQAVLWKVVYKEAASSYGVV